MQTIYLNKKKMKTANPEFIEKIVRDMAKGIGPRPLKHPEKLQRARDLILGYFEDLGLETCLQPVFYKGIEYHNVLAATKGVHPLEPQAEPILVVGAHYDTVASSPGADDNASGIAALIATAKSLATVNLNRVIYAAFCMEEPPVFRTKNMGSFWYARHLKKSGQALMGMICLEMVGYFSDIPGSQKYPFPMMNKMYPDKGNFIAIVGNLKSRNFTLKLKELFKSYGKIPVETLNAPAIMIGIDFSDHWSFQKHGYNAVMITDTAFYRNPHYHRPTDTPATLDYKKAAQVVDGLAYSIKALCAKSNLGAK